MVQVHRRFFLLPMQGLLVHPGHLVLKLPPVNAHDTSTTQDTNLLPTLASHLDLSVVTLAALGERVEPGRSERPLTIRFGVNSRSHHPWVLGVGSTGLKAGGSPRRGAQWKMISPKICRITDHTPRPTGRDTDQHLSAGMSGHVEKVHL